MPEFPRRSILTTRIAAISSRSRGSGRCRIGATDALNTMLTRRNKRSARRILKAEHNELHESNGHKGLDSRGMRRRGGPRCRVASGGIAVACEFNEGG